MISRFGEYISVGWSPSEEDWLTAILEMGAQPAHLKELSDITGRSMASIGQHIVAKHFNEARQKARDEKREKLIAQARL